MSVCVKKKKGDKMKMKFEEMKIGQLHTLTEQGYEGIVDGDSESVEVVE